MSTTTGEKLVLSVGVLNVILFFIFLNFFSEVRNDIKTIKIDVEGQWNHTRDLQSKIDKLVPIEKIQLLDEIKKDIANDVEDDMIFIPPRSTF